MPADLPVLHWALIMPAMMEGMSGGSIDADVGQPWRFRVALRRRS
jgi:hypothetical protein